MCYNIFGKAVILMNCSLKTGGFEIKYTESEISNSILWENHCHAQFEMIGVVSGDVSVVLEGRSCRLKENQCIIIPPLCYHSITINGGGTYRRVTALFDLAAVPVVLHPEFTKRCADAAIFFSPGADRLGDICRASDSHFYEPLAESFMIQLFYDMLNAQTADTKLPMDDFLQRVVSYIDQHLCEKILLDDLARETSRSKSSFCHLFEEKMNVSPKQYILQKKLALASKLIVEGTQPTLAAIEVGYENYSNFYRLYMKHYGTAPTKRK